ncbi:aquaporin family protein [Rhodopirellula sp.]|nr:MIP/aquaporin family protein [Rhodopirellula sp.]MDB4679149.1 aquaporin family protein [Rhodopirellula sp.]
MHPFAAEFVGTMMLILFGNGVVANVLLKKTNGAQAGWMVICAGWGIAVYIGAICAQEISGAHLNPAVTLAMFLNDEIGVWDSLGYATSQMLGAALGAGLVYAFYREHFHLTKDQDAKLGCFANTPVVRNFGQAFFCEVIGTFALVLPVFLMTKPSLILTASQAGDAPVMGLGSIGALPVGLLVFGIGLSLGGTTGYAINPARDLAPRIMHALLPIPNKRDSDWSYSWIPVAGPLVGAVLAVAVFRALGWFSI